jgi:hypothetical protein
MNKVFVFVTCYELKLTADAINPSINLLALCAPSSDFALAFGPQIAQTHGLEICCQLF